MSIRTLFRFILLIVAVGLWVFGFYVHYKNTFFSIVLYIAAVAVAVYALFFAKERY